MTFTPQVLSQVDNNNSIISSTDSSFNGISTLTTGFNTLILTINSTTDSSAGGIQIEFSDNNSTWITPYTDTYFSTNTFTKNYLIIKKYYRVVYKNYSSGTFSLTSRLSTDLDSSITQNTSITVFDNNLENTLDAFGKLRVSYPITLLDIRFPGQSDGSSNFLKNNIQICSAFGESSGITPVGTYENSKLKISIPFDASANTNKYYISQSRTYCTYQPGKSLLYLATGIFDPAGADGNIESFKNLLNGNGDIITSRIGYYDFSASSISTNIPTVQNGLFLQIEYNNISGTKTRTVSFNIKNDTLTSISQNNWNIDKMDGTGPSGLNLNFTKCQLMVIDMEWLGVGRIRFGFYAYGRIQYCHQVTNINFLTQPYTNSINLPSCYSLCGTNNQTRFIGQLTQICSTVISEGGYNPSGKPFVISTGSTAVNLSSNTETPILFLRGGGTGYYHQNIIPTSISMICSDVNNLILYKLVLFFDGAYLGSTTPSWQQVNSNSIAQYAVGTSGYSSTNGIVLDSGYFYGRGTNTFSALTDVFNSVVLQINSNITNVSDILVLTATWITSGGGSTSVYGTLSWQELY
jgi:hypothetical protein